MLEFDVKDMSCGHCAGSVTKAAKLVDPAAKVDVDLANKKVKVESQKDRSLFAKALTDAGYPTA